MKICKIIVLFLLVWSNTQAQRPFVTKWDTRKSRTSVKNQITIPTTGTGYNYTVEWGDGNTDTEVTGNITHTYSTPDIYTVNISGDFPRVYFNESIIDQKEALKLISIERWGEINWTSMENAFSGCTNLQVNATDAPDLSKVSSLKNMFRFVFNANPYVKNWDVSKVTDMSGMFYAVTRFNQDLTDWNVEKVTNMSSMLAGAKEFNQDISSWNVGNVTNMVSMFAGANVFNQDISSWNVENVTNMSNMFSDTKVFNQNISIWNVANVTDMSGMFEEATDFNKDLNIWNTENVTNMSNMFANATSFNQNIMTWNVANVTNMSEMFANATSFNQNITTWNVANVTDMSSMFANATSFNQNLGSWNIGKLEKADNMLHSCGLSQANYDRILQAWASATDIPSDLNIDAFGLTYCAGTITRKELIDNYNWTFTGDVQICESESFITLWQTDTPDCETANNQIKIPTEGTGYNYTVDWGDENTDNGITGDITHTYDKPGMYTVKITGSFPRIYFDEVLNLKDAKKLVAIAQWGNNKWQTMKSAFGNCENMIITASDSPDLSNVKDMSYMFKKAKSFNNPIGDWDVSNVENMSGLFSGAFIFNQDISNWDVSNVTDMSSMFSRAKEFNQPIGKWDVSNVYAMTSMFEEAKKFNQPIGDWNMSKVEFISKMFSGATMFNQPINEWDVTKANFMLQLFSGASVFNQDISKWDVSNVGSMELMFEGAYRFNQDISGWDIGKVKYINGMFHYALDFNQDISGWNLSGVSRTNGMFFNAKSFNQDISGWDLENVIFMDLMFYGAEKFDQDLGSWNIIKVKDMEYMFDKSNMSSENYDATLAGWASKSSTPHNIKMGAEDLEYCNETGRNKLINDFGWTINGDTQNCLAWYTVTFKTEDDLILKNVKVKEGEAAIAPIMNDFPGYVFLGWDTDFSAVTSDLTVTSKYAISTFNVVFNDHDGTQLKTEIVEFKKAATAPINPVKTGYTFTRWDMSFDKVTSDLNITAQYSKNGATNYTVIFNDWNNLALKTETVVENDKAIAPANPVKNGYTFNGWDTDFSKITTDLTVTAEYSINTYNVVFNDYDDSELKTEKVEFEKSATAPANPTREGYTFRTWDKKFDKITSDLFLTAQYEEITDIKSMTNIDAKVYPNPVNDLLNLEFDNNFDNKCVIEIYSLTGHFILKCNINSNKTSINTNLWKAGSYIIIVKNDNNIYRSKIIKR